MPKSQIVDTRGNPMTSVQGHSNFDGADIQSPELAAWRPPLVTADAALLPELDTLRARTEDLIRNHGLLSGAVQTHLDNVVGPSLRLEATPDWMALGQSEEWAQEWATQVEVEWRQYADDDINCWADTTRHYSFGGLLQQAYRSYITSFEILALADWLPSRGGRYSTCVQLTDPMRLSNPHHRGDTRLTRKGVVHNARGVATHYWIASNLSASAEIYGGMTRWRKVPRETRSGRQIVIHIYDVDRPGASRGRNGLVSILAEGKNFSQFKQATLQAAILNAMYAATIESSLDWNSVGDAIGAGDEDPSLAYLKNTAAFHKDGHVRYNGVKIPHLFPGEKLTLTSPQHPNPEFSSFEDATLRYFAGAMNLSYEQVSRNYSNTNYSSARAAMLESFRHFKNSRTTVAARFARMFYALWLEEAMDKGIVERPPGAPTFNEAKTAWTKSVWHGPGRGHIDPQKEKRGMEIDFQNGMTSMTRESAERGEDWQDTIRQRAREIAFANEVAEQMGVEASQLLPAAYNPGATSPQTADPVEVEVQQ